MADDDTPEPGEPDASEDIPAKPAEKPKDTPKTPAVLPDDHPLVKAYQATKARLREREDAEKSDLDKATDKATEAEKRAATAEAKALRLEVAVEKGLAPDLMEFLTGDTREELEAKAEKLATFTPADDDEASARRTPRERLRSTVVPDAKPDSSDPAELVKSIPRT